MSKLLLSSLCMIGILTGISFGAPSPSIVGNEKLDYRLNTDIEPIDYIIEVTPYFDDKTPGKKAFSFDGIVRITLKTSKSNVNQIVLHKQDMHIKAKNLTKASNIGSLAFTSEKYDNITKKYTINLSQPLIKDEEYTLNFEYTGKLQSDMLGFYRSSYKEGNETKWLASTKLEPFHARKVFPCFDEPRFKATFTVIINRPAHFRPSVSNTPLVTSHRTSSNRYREIFRKTPKMSTYLVAFIVSEFECRENEAGDFNVCSRPNAYDQTEYSFNVGQKVLAKYDELFDYGYNKQMKKMSMAALPDFPSGAMENWGLLTFRETSLLYDRNVSTSMAQQRVATVVAHEQAHMWFGDLVTCRWWSHTWLNEGFATFFEYFGTAMVESTWGLEKQFTVDELQSVFGEDSLESTLALSHDVNTPAEIKDRFGGISYNKGGSVIRMFEHALGHDTFIAAIRNYLRNNALQTAVPETLFLEFQKEVGDKLDIADVMGSWVYQPGYPLITVKVASDRKSATISQKRFLRNNVTHDDKTLWKVPITFASDKQNTNFSSTMPIGFLSTESMQIDFEESIDWIVFNVQQTGYYRVNYDNETWSAIADRLQTSPSSINVLNRAQIVDDALNLARSSQLDYVKALQTIQYLENEMEYAPWKAAFNGFDFILARFKPDESYLFEEFMLNLLNKVYDHLGFRPKKSDTRLDVYTRNYVLKYACKFGHKQCIADARTEFDHSMRASYKIPVDLVPVVYCSVIAEGSENEWNSLWNKFKSGNVAAEQVTILAALGCSKRADLIKKYFDLILSNDIRLQDKHAALVSTMTYQQNLDLVLDLVIEKHNEMNTAFEADTEVPTILSQLVSRATTTQQIDRIQKFADENQLNEDKSLKLALNGAKLNLNWSERNVPTIKDFIKSRTNSDTTQTASNI